VLYSLLPLNLLIQDQATKAVCYFNNNDDNNNNKNIIQAIRKHQAILSYATYEVRLGYFILKCANYVVFPVIESKMSVRTVFHSRPHNSIVLTIHIFIDVNT